METVYYNYYAFEGAKVSGGEDRRVALVREYAPRRNTEHKVISLEDYRARQAALAHEDPEEEEELPCVRDTERTAARSRGREALLMGLELLSCAAMIAVAAVACVIFLL